MDFAVCFSYGVHQVAFGNCTRHLMPIQVGEPRRETECLINLSQGDLLQTSVPDMARRLALPVVVKLHVLRDLDPQRPLNTLFVISQAFKNEFSEI